MPSDSVTEEDSGESGVAGLGSRCAACLTCIVSSSPDSPGARPTRLLLRIPPRVGGMAWAGRRAMRLDGAMRGELMMVFVGRGLRHGEYLGRVFIV